MLETIDMVVDRAKTPDSHEMTESYRLVVLG